LAYKDGERDCDEIYQQLHNGSPSTDSETLTVYPNPVSGILFVETLHAPSLPAETYRITNLMGQTLLQGSINTENQQIDIANLPAGMYFINVGEQTAKFVVR
jgi:hypothetical protein